MSATQRSAPAPPDSLATPVAHAEEARPFLAWERRTRFWALVFAVVTLGVTLLGAVVLIRAGRPAGTTVVLAPACSSFDEFPNYSVRGRAFKEAVLALGERQER